MRRNDPLDHPRGRIRRWYGLLLFAATAAGLMASAAPVAGAAPTSTLVLYDNSGPWAALGEIYGIQSTNLVSHFTTAVTRPVSQYVAGDVEKYVATIYIGSTYDEPLPASFLADVKATNRPILWMNYNIWQLNAADPSFGTRYGWLPGALDYSTVKSVTYKGTVMSRSELNTGGILAPTMSNPTAVKVLAEAVRPDGTKFPWAVRSGNLTYVGEIPFSYANETDRYLIFSDILFDLLAPTTPERHRALVRIEDVSPESDPVEIRAIADYLSSKRVPFTLAVIPLWKDPSGIYSNGVASTIALKDRPQLVNALKYAQARGATVIMHGYTHQYSNVSNPYDGATADDFEFYRSTVDVATDDVLLLGPVPEDSTAWALSRYDAGRAAFTAAKMSVPTIFEFPHYAASAVDYRAVGQRFATRYERSLYFPGVLTGGAIDYSRLSGQFFPYAVKDVYGAKVIPENLGNIELQAFNNHPARLPADLLNNSAKQKVVRDGVASFFFHPFLETTYLKQMIEGMQAQGYVFVAPNAV